MIRFLSAAAVSLTVMSSGAALADCGGVVCANVTIERLYVRASGNVSLYTSGTETQLDCAPSGDAAVTILSSAVGFNALYSLALTVMQQNDPVTIRVDNGTGNCVVNYMYKDYVQ